VTTTWAAIALIAAGCFAFKLAGLSVPDRVLEHRLTVQAAHLIPVALLGALIAVQVLGGDHTLVVDARLAALAVAFVLLMLRVPFLPMVFAAAATAALLRLL
jgi:branched chain amino acid efflux pump